MAVPDPRAALPLAPERFAEAVALLAAADATEPDRARRAAHARVLAGVAKGLADDLPARALLAALPRAFAAAMAPWGWAWNGFYALGRDGRLHLGHAHGPPVCAELERSGGALSSGMCFDALLLGEVLLAPDVKRWPGYVSCDAESGLRTVGGLVVPLRDPAGAPLGVWDLDATEPVTPGDARFAGALFACLGRTRALAPADLGAAAVVG